MYAVGIDMGSTCTKLIAMDQEQHIVLQNVIPTGWNCVSSAEGLRGELQTAGISQGDFRCVATGYGRVSVPYADKTVTEISCHGKGACWLFGEKDLTVIDIGGQDTKVIQMEKGLVKDFNMNDKCSAGTGKFLEIMAATLGVDLNDLCELAKTSTEHVSISSMCTVFAESEVVSLVGKGTAKADIAWGIVDSIANKVKGQVGKIRLSQGKVYLTGGLCEVPYILEALSQKLETPVLTQPMARYAGAIGAALAALEILDAAGMIPVGLCGMSEETIPDAETVLPKNLCPLIKSSYGFALSQKCPYTYWSDVIIGETTCDGKKKMYELLGKLKQTYILHLPQGVKADYALAFWRQELADFQRYIEETFQVTITQDKLREAADLRNRVRKATVQLMEFQRLNPAPIDSLKLYQFLDNLKYTFDLEAYIASIEALSQELQQEISNSQMAADKKRILITGCPIGGAIEKVTAAVENNGGRVVCYENCSGIKAARQYVDTQAPDILTAIAEAYLGIGCAVMTPNERRMENLASLQKEFQADGIIDVTLQACTAYMVETETVRELYQAQDIPYMALETDYSKADSGQIDTRIAAFIETL